MLTAPHRLRTPPGLERSSCRLPPARRRSLQIYTGRISWIPQIGIYHPLLTFFFKARRRRKRVPRVQGVDQKKHDINSCDITGDTFHPIVLAARRPLKGVYSVGSDCPRPYDAALRSDRRSGCDQSDRTNTSDIGRRKRCRRTACAEAGCQRHQMDAFSKEGASYPLCEPLTFQRRLPWRRSRRCVRAICLQVVRRSRDAQSRPTASRRHCRPTDDRCDVLHS